MPNIPADRGPLMGVRYFAGFALVGPVTFLAHHAAHWAAGRLLAVPVTARLTAIAMPVATESRDALLVLAAGPAATVLQAVLALAVLRVRDCGVAYAFLFWAVFSRLFATAAMVVEPSDESRIAGLLGLWSWTLPLAVSALLLVLLSRGSRRLGVWWRTNLAAYAVAAGTVGAMAGVGALL